MAADATSGAAAPAALPAISTKPVHYIPYRGEDDLPDLIALIEKDLSEPYSVFTYRYFVNHWPELCFLAVVLNENDGEEGEGQEVGKEDAVAGGGGGKTCQTEGEAASTVEQVPASAAGAIDNESDKVLDADETFKEQGKATSSSSALASYQLRAKLQQRSETRIIGGIISKLEEHKSHFVPGIRGYIGMLAVDSSFRRRGIARKLVELTLDKMEKNGGDECILETELTNLKARQLYESVGFVKHKRLNAYYLNGVDAFRFKYAFPAREGFLDEFEAEEKKQAAELCAGAAAGGGAAAALEDAAPGGSVSVVTGAGAKKKKK
eukprot:g4654.t1